MIKIWDDESENRRLWLGIGLVIGAEELMKRIGWFIK